MNMDASGVQDTPGVLPKENAYAGGRRTVQETAVSIASKNALLPATR
jgi:hypothetical protein